MVLKCGLLILIILFGIISWKKKCGKFLCTAVGFRQVKGLREEDMEILIAARKKKCTSTLMNYGMLVCLNAALEKLADADAFRSIGLDRRQALWEVSTKDRPVKCLQGQAASRCKNRKYILPVMSAIRTCGA